TTFYCFGTKYQASLNPAQTPGRLAFRTKGSFDASSGWDGAKKVCQDEAAASAITAGHSFLPLLSTSTVAAKAAFADGAVWVRTDGIPVTRLATDLLNGVKLLAPISVAADGVTYSGLPVRSGAFEPNLTSSGPEDSCMDWSTASVAHTSYIGVPVA